MPRCRPVFGCPRRSGTSRDCEIHLEDIISRPGVARVELAALHHELGRLYARTEPAAALEHYRRAAALPPPSVAFCADLGADFFKLCRYDEAIEQLEKVVLSTPRSADARNNLGAALAAGGRLGEATAEYRTALGIDARHADAHYNLAAALATCGRLDEAIGQFRDALRIDCHHVKALNALAWLRATHPDAAFRNGPEAVELARRAIETSGKTAELLDTLAAAYAETGMFPEAAATVGEALELARQQNQPELVERLKARLCLYDVVHSPYRESQDPPALAPKK